MSWTLYEGDCLDIMPAVPTESVHLVFADPPYNIGKAEWDRIDGYLAWCERWIAECSRILRPNGAFWVSHSEPDVLVEISRLIAAHGRPRLNWITWDKYNGTTGGVRYLLNRTKVANPNDKRRFDYDAEYLVYHANEGQSTFAALVEKHRKANGLSRQDVSEAVVGTRSGACWNWEAGIRIPTREHWDALSGLLGIDVPHAGLRREYEELRPTFNNPGKVSSVWQFDPAPRNGHPTPKPEPLLERIILTCINPGDVVLDPFAGSGTTLAVAERLGRDSIGIELAADYCGLIRRRMGQRVLQFG